MNPFLSPKKSYQPNFNDNSPLELQKITEFPSAKEQKNKTHNENKSERNNFFP